MQQCRADGHVAETEDCAEVKQRHLQARLVFEFDLQRLVVEVQITAGRLDIQRVEKLMQDELLSWDQSATSRRSLITKRDRAARAARALPSVTVGRHDSRR